MALSFCKRYTSGVLGHFRSLTTPPLSSSTTTSRCINRPYLETPSSTTKPHRIQPNPTSARRQRYIQAEHHPHPHIHQATALSISDGSITRHPYSRILTGTVKPEYHAFQDFPLLRLSRPYACLLFVRVCQRGSCRSGLADQNMKTFVWHGRVVDAVLLGCGFVVVLRTRVKGMLGFHVLFY